MRHIARLSETRFGFHEIVRNRVLRRQWHFNYEANIALRRNMQLNGSSSNIQLVKDQVVARHLGISKYPFVTYFYSY